MRGAWSIGVFGLGVLGGAAWPRAEPAELRVRALLLVDEQGREVGRFATTPRGAELVVGGEAQASLVTEGGAAALNLLGERTMVRALDDPGEE